MCKSSKKNKEKSLVINNTEKATNRSKLKDEKQK